jgi:branched-chain amino acid transport system permease protein
MFIILNVANGLMVGTFFVLMALGLSLILNLSNVINFAHGNFLALGAYLALVLTHGDRFTIDAFAIAIPHVLSLSVGPFDVDIPPTMDFWGALLVAPILTALVGMVVELLMRRVYRRDPIYSLLLTFGLAFVMQGFMLWHWGPTPKQIDVPHILQTPITPDLFFISWYRIFMVVIVAAVVLGLFAFLRYTRIGLRIRAGTLDLDTVSALGVNVKLLRTFNFALGCLLAGLSGALAIGAIGLNPNMGDDLLMPSFIAIIVGGVGSLTGTLFGGLLIGVAAAFTAAIYPAASEVVIFVMMIVVLLIRPRGLMGEEGMLS